MTIPGTVELLTADEQAALDLLCQFANLMHRIAKPEGVTYAHDWAEAADKIHQLQSMVMSQAAARAYPDQFRLLGGTSL